MEKRGKTGQKFQKFCGGHISMVPKRNQPSHSARKRRGKCRKGRRMDNISRRMVQITLTHTRTACKNKKSRERGKILKE